MLRVCRNDTARTDAGPAINIIKDQPLAVPDMGERSHRKSLRRPKSVVQLSDESHTHLLAIDNSLAFPQHHPRGWRSFTYGWLYLPVSMIGLPWSDQSRQHFLNILTDKSWWEDTSKALRLTFAKDPDFNANQFRKQLALIKVAHLEQSSICELTLSLQGQAFNLVQSLRNPNEGPLGMSPFFPFLAHFSRAFEPRTMSEDLVFGMGRCCGRPAIICNTCRPF